jgi:pimeloyl-ACP methyl ester carboxylesterase
MGLSDWNVQDFGFDRSFEDLEAVVEAAGIDRFALFGLPQGCSISIAYAARHPERVSRLILLDGYAQGWKHRGDPVGAVIRRAAVEMMRVGRERDNPAVRQMFTSLYMPDAPPESRLWFSELQRRTASADNVAVSLDAYGDADVTGLLDAVRAPTLVIRARRDSGVSYEQGHLIAAGIPARASRRWRPPTTYSPPPTPHGSAAPT